MSTYLSTMTEQAMVRKKAPPPVLAPGAASKVVFGYNLRAARKRLGKTQSDVAKISNISVPTISLIERGEVNVSIETMDKLAEAVGAITAELLHRR